MSSNTYSLQFTSSSMSIFQLLEAMVKDSNIPLESLQVDGGMTMNSLLMQLQADLMGIIVGKWEQQKDPSPKEIFLSVFALIDRFLKMGRFI